MTLSDHLSAYKNAILVLSVLAVASTSILLLILLRLAQILPTPSKSQAEISTSDTEPRITPKDEDSTPAHLLIVLGSGGHTAEMLNVLSSSLPDLPLRFTQRTYLVSSGDAFSAQKAAEFEKTLGVSAESSTYSIATVRRARRVHQSWLSTPYTTLLSLWDCVAVLRGTYAQNSQGIQKAASHVTSCSYPDLILTNGPGTGVCVVVAALLLRFFGFDGEGTMSIQPTNNVRRRRGAGQMRTIFLESWARVKTLSLSGRILRPLVNRFIVQWPQLANQLGEGVEYIGPLVS